MAKGQEKPKRDKKKPKQQKSDAPKSAYAQRMAEKGTATPFITRK
jgi:hypothetical protein